MDLVKDRRLHLDWDFIFKILNIPVAEGRAELNRSAKAYMTSNKYPQLLQWASKIWEGPIVVIGNWGTDWAGADLWPYLIGDHNPDLQKNQSLLEYAKKAFGASYLGSQPEAFKLLYKGQLEKRLGETTKPIRALSELLEIHQEIIVDIFGPSKYKYTDPGTSVVQIQHDVISNCGNPQVDKRELLSRLFTNNPSESRDAQIELSRGRDSGYNGIIESPQMQEKVLPTLSKNGIISQPSDYLPLGGEYKYSFDHWRRVQGLEDQLNKEFSSLLTSYTAKSTRFGSIENFLAKVFPKSKSQKDMEHGSDYAGILRMKNRISSSLMNIPLSHDQLIKVFEYLTYVSPTDGTDRLFRKIWPTLNIPLNEAKKVLVEKRLKNPKLQVSVARIVITDEIVKLSGKKADANVVKNLIEQIKLYSPNDTTERDQLLEDLAWKLKIENLELLKAIEDAKSFNWRKANPTLINRGSFLSSLIKHMNRSERVELIHYLMKPEGLDLPAGLMKLIERAVDDTRPSPKERTDNIWQKKTEIESFVNSTTIKERIPVFELLLSGGYQPLAQEKDFAKVAAREFLGYKPNEVDEKILAAYFRAVPTHERSVTMAYLIGQTGSDVERKSLAPLFSAFKTVGIKAGQLASVWRLFGESVSKDLADLKDNAEPLSKFEVRKIFEATLSAQELGQIKSIKEILGSASMKTVVLVELIDGRQTVALVQRPNAENQIRSNLKRARAFLSEIKVEGYTSIAMSMEGMLDPIEEQLSEELKMTTEAHKIESMKRFYSELNEELRKRGETWRFEVPGVASGFQTRDNLLFIDRAYGLTFDRLDAGAAKVKAGELIVGSSLRALFKNGLFDGDRHARNFMIDPKRMVIYPIDFGQTDYFSRNSNLFSADDTYRIARFLEAVSKRNVTMIVDAGFQLVTSTARSGDNKKAQIISELNQSIRDSSKNESDIIIDAVNAFSHTELPFQKKFSFVAFKGLLMLNGEGYTTEVKFREILYKNVQQAIVRKIPVAIKDAVRMRTNNFSPKGSSAAKSCAELFLGK